MKEDTLIVASLNSFGMSYRHEFIIREVQFISQTAVMFIYFNLRVSSHLAKAVKTFQFCFNHPLRPTRRFFPEWKSNAQFRTTQWQLNFFRQVRLSKKLTSIVKKWQVPHPFGRTNYWLFLEHTLHCWISLQSAISGIQPRLCFIIFKLFSLSNNH